MGSVGSRTWIYLVIAFVVLPILVPVVIMLLEPTARRKWRIAPFLAIGTGVSVVLLETMLRNHPTVTLGRFHLAYSIGLQHGTVIIGLYIVATCGSLLASGFRDIVVFGLANVVAVVILARLSGRMGLLRCGASMPPLPAEVGSSCTCAMPNPTEQRPMP